MQTLSQFLELLNTVLQSCQYGKTISPSFLDFFVRRSFGLFEIRDIVKLSRVYRYIDIESLRHNKCFTTVLFQEELNVSKITTKKLSSKKFKINRVDWTLYPYHVLYTKPKVLEFLGYFKNLYLDFVVKHLEHATSFMISKYICFSSVTEKVFLSEIFSTLEWKKSTIMIRGNPCLSKVISKEITDFDLYVKKFKYNPIDLNQFIVVDSIANNIYYDCYGNKKNSYNYFQIAHWFINHDKYFLHTKEVTTCNNFKIWMNFYPGGVANQVSIVSFFDFQNPSKYFKDVRISLFDFSNNEFVFNKENLKFQHVISFNNIFVTLDKFNNQFGLFFSYKTDSDLFKFLSSIFFIATFDNFIISEWLNSLYFYVGKDFIINNKSDFNILYKTIGSWNNYSELDFGVNGRWFLESKIVNQKVVYDWKWKKNFNTFVPNAKYNVEHFVSNTNFSNFSEIKIKILQNSVSTKIDKKILGEIFIFKKLIQETTLIVESEATRVMWEDFRRYRTCRFWRHFPHHAEYVKKYFTDPKTRNK